MKAVIFGANGQDGFYLSQICETNNIQPLKISRTNSELIGDVSNFDFVRQIIKEHKPSYIFHVAANSTTRHDVLFENNNTIATGTLNILESVYTQIPDCRVFITGSGVQFFNDGEPISEQTPFEGNSPYSVSRIQSIYASRYYRSLGLKVYNGYLFHHESPLRKSNHMSQKIVSAAINIQKGRQKIFEVGDTSVEKEWGFAGDIAEGIFTLVNQDNIFEAVIGTGKGYTIEQWINTCFRNLGLNPEEHIKIIPGFKPEYPRLISNPALINSLGWNPKVSFDNLASMMIESAAKAS